MSGCAREPGPWYRFHIIASALHPSAVSGADLRRVNAQALATPIASTGTKAANTQKPAALTAGAAAPFASPAALAAMPTAAVPTA